MSVSEVVALLGPPGECASAWDYILVLDPDAGHPDVSGIVPREWITSEGCLIVYFDERRRVVGKGVGEVQVQRLGWMDGAQEWLSRRTGR
jgi:hypothetical protein